MAKYKIIPSSETIVQSPISIGHKAEKGVEAIEFDVTAWVETYGSGTLTVIMRRWGDAIPYPIALEIDENNKATWTLSDIDTAKAGMAYAQLSYIVGDEVVKKSDIYTFSVMDSLTGEGDPPEAYESWLESLTHLAAEAMAEVLDIEGVATDKTLTVDGGIADGKAAGDALALKADKSTTYTKSDVDQMIEDVVNVQKTAVQASQERIDSYSRYQSFNDLPVGEIVNLFSNIKLADGPQGYNPIGHKNLDDGKYNATVLTYSAETDPGAIVQVCIFYVSGGFTNDKEPRTATRYAIKTNGTIVWSDWSIMSSNMVLHSTDKVVDVNSYSTVTFSDFNDAEPNGIYQVDLNVGTTILNNPSPGHSGLLMTFSFSPVSHHALVQNFYALEKTGIEMYFRYGYKQSPSLFEWTHWKKVATAS